ncbi:MAG: hypothetical protein JNK16_06235 [Phycisphaerales bacterium]|nr:hypothetical protein [Phycisphaerales bacterium]
METLKPTPIELPPPGDEASMLAFYLEGIPLVQIARALRVGIPTVLDFIREEDVRACIQQYEESIERQTRLFALGSRIPAMATLREVCASQGSLAERRRAASDLLRQSHAADKPAKGRRFGRTAHNTPTPEKFMPNPDAPCSPDIPREVRPLEPYEMTLDLNFKPPADSQPPSSTTDGSSTELDQPPASEPDRTPIQSESPTPTPAPTPAQTAAQIESAPQTEGSFIAEEHTASWHAFDREEPISTAPSPETHAATPNHTQSAPEIEEQPLEPQPIEPQRVEPRPLLVRQPPTGTPSPYDSFCAREVSTPLPDAVPVAA